MESLTNVRPHLRREEPFERSEIIVDDGELRLEVPSLRRVFDFTSAGKAVGPKAKAIAKALTEYYTRFSRSTAIATHLAVSKLFDHIAATPKHRKKLRAAPTLNANPGIAAWQSAVAERLAAMSELDRLITTHAEEVGCLFRALDELASRGLAAKCQKPRLPKNYHAAGGHRPTLVEQSGSEPVSKLLIENIERRIAELDLHVEGKDVSALIRALAAQVPQELLHDETTFVDAINGLNTKSLRDIRQVAEDTYITWRDVWEKGQELLESTPSSVADQIAEGLRLPKHLAKRTLTDLLSPQHTAAARGNILKYYGKYHNYRVPQETELLWPIGAKRLQWSLGGRYDLDASFCLHRAGVAAAILLYLVDAGANAAVALSLRTDCESLTDDENIVEIDSVKERVGPEPLVKALPIRETDTKVTAVEALRGVRRMTAGRRKLYPNLPDALFIFSHWANPSVATSEFLANNLRYMLRGTGLPKDWTPSAIRVSVALKVAGHTRGDFARVGRVLQHVPDSSSTPIYALRLPIRLMLVRRIREFTTLYEVAFASQSPRAVQALGYSEDVGQFLLSKARRTGLGFLCKDPLAGAQPGVKAGENCSKVGNCPSCTMRLFLVDIQSLAEVLATHSRLGARQEELEASQAQRWHDTWLDLYAFTCVVIEKTKTSRFAYLLPRARKRAETLLSNGFDPLLLRP